MPFIPADDTAQVKVVQRLHDQTINNVMYFRNATGWSTVELTALANLVIDWWNDNIAPTVSNEYQLVGVQARDMTEEDAAGIEIAAPPLSGGEIPSPSLPGNVALAVKFITGLTGRNRRGRNFVAGLAEATVNGNQMLAINRDLFVGAYGALRNAVLAAGYEHVVASFYDGTVLVPLPDGQIVKRPLPRPAGALITPIEQYTADLDVDSQRRRLTGRGT